MASVPSTSNVPTFASSGMFHISEVIVTFPVGWTSCRHSWCEHRQQQHDRAQGQQSLDACEPPPAGPVAGIVSGSVSPVARRGPGGQGSDRVSMPPAFGGDGTGAGFRRHPDSCRGLACVATMPPPVAGWPWRPVGRGVPERMGSAALALGSLDPARRRGELPQVALRGRAGPPRHRRDRQCISLPSCHPVKRETGPGGPVSCSELWRRRSDSNR